MLLQSIRCLSQSEGRIKRDYRSREKWWNSVSVIVAYILLGDLHSHDLNSYLAITQYGISYIYKYWNEKVTLTILQVMVFVYFQHTYGRNIRIKRRSISMLRYVTGTHLLKRKKYSRSPLRFYTITYNRYYAIIIRVIRPIFLHSWIGYIMFWYTVNIRNCAITRIFISNVISKC